MGGILALSAPDRRLEAGTGDLGGASRPIAVAIRDSRLP